MLGIKANVPFKQKIILWGLCFLFSDLLNSPLKSLAIIQENIPLNIPSGLSDWT